MVVMGRRGKTTSTAAAALIGLVLAGLVFWAPPVAAEVLLPENAPECLIRAALLAEQPGPDCPVRGLVDLSDNAPVDFMTFNGIPGRPVGVLITFGFNSHELRPGSRQVLSSLGRVINSLDRHDAISIAGHTDLSGSAAVNLELSKQRAQAAMRYLIETAGIEPSRLQSEGFGFSHLYDPGHPYDPKNRRVTFLLHQGAIK